MSEIDRAITHFEDMVRLGESRHPRGPLLNENKLALEALKEKRDREKGRE